MGRPRATPEQRLQSFWNRVDKSPGFGPWGNCWKWTGGYTGSGYGGVQYRDAGGNKQQCNAHRYSYILHYGPVADDLVVMHECDNPQCVRPDHLTAGTPKKNTQDAVARGLTRTGERSPFATLSDADARAVRAAYNSMPTSSTGRKKRYGDLAALAERFGIDKHTVIRIGTGRQRRYTV